WVILTLYDVPLAFRGYVAATQELQRLIVEHDQNHPQVQNG
ncbi:unnamed protein product, partial [marine sediment metagenome]